MICKNCETENPEEAVYCKNCGKRLDGKLVCPSCGRENPEDAKVCMTCGTQLVQNNSAPVNSAPAKEKTAGGWKKWVELAGGISAIIGVFCVLLCVYLLGVTATVSYSEGWFSYSQSQTQDIWYYFGDVWKEIEDLTTNNGALLDDFPMLKADMYLEALFGLFISIGTILSVLVFSIIAAVRFGMKTAGKSNKDYLGAAVGAVMSFICGTALLMAMNAAHFEAEGATAIISPNGAGVAGIVCGLVFLCACIGTRIATKGKELITKKSIMQLAFSAGALVLLSIAIAFVTKPLCILNEEFSGLEYEGLEFEEGKLSFLGWASILSMGDSEELGGAFALSILALAVQFAVIITAVAAISSRLKNLAAENPKSGLASSIGLTIVSAVFLAFAISALAVSADKLELEKGFNYAYIIVEFVFAVLTIVVAAVYKGLSHEKKQA